ncbi:unnamed protein product [Rotaria sp. Silwood1]|nr:unnamed protein product [Rotaria sp. Silwood1]
MLCADMDDNSPQSKSSIQASGLSNSTSGQVPQVKYSNNQHSSQTASSNNDLLVYIPDIPTNISEKELEEMIQTRISTNLRIKMSDIKCYSNLGVAVIRLMNEEDKKHLVSNVQSMVLDYSIEIYPKIPTADEVARRYMQVYTIADLRSCQQISVQFPNIFRFSLNTFDEPVKAVKNPDFKIGSAFATVYLRADCSYFEDLPPYTNDENISSAIATQIDENKLQLTSFYVQYNKQTVGALRFCNIMMQIVSHILAADPDKTEINAENWYETEMFNIKPDIMTMIRNLQHPIFRYKWNAQIWIEQMKKLDVRDRQ